MVVSLTTKPPDLSDKLKPLNIFAPCDTLITRGIFHINGILFEKVGQKSFLSFSKKFIKAPPVKIALTE